MKNRYVLDSFAILAYVWDEGGSDRIEELLRQAKKKEVELFLSRVNWAESYYMICRKENKEKADAVIAMIKEWPIQFVETNESIGLVAGKIKANKAVSLGDAFAIATAIEKGAEVVTGDPEFEKVADDVSVFWINR